MTKQIKNIIFDVGNVLFNYNPAQIIDNLIPNSAHKQFYLDNVFNSEHWQLMDRGDLSLSKLQEILQKEHNTSSQQQKDIATLVNNFTKHLTLNEEMKELFNRMSSYYNVYILSNFQSSPFKQLLKDNPFLDKAKGIVVSADVMMKKPEVGIFHFLLSQYRIIPQQSLFIDDLEDNIKTAKKLLINTIHFKSYSQTMKQIQSLKLLEQQ
jgi:FMN phosphatase YigB (HAD superfamily)